jgi:60 kDa SS-A/Ro ribonucleoprotein
MANPLSTVPAAGSVNEAGGLAYRLPPKHALAQLAATGCLSGTYYADADAQLTTLVGLTEQVEDRYLAQTALYARARGLMKDMPAALLVPLSKRNPALFRQVFPRVIDNGRMLRTFFQFVRSGQFGRRSLSYALQKAIQHWLNEASVGTLLSASVGNDPSLRDVLRLARPTPKDNARRALFGWLTGKDPEKWAPATTADLPVEVQDLVAFRKAQTEEEQIAILARSRFRWDLVADTILGPTVWKAITRQMGPQALRMNLNTLLRHGVFEDAEMVTYVAERLSDAAEVRRARQFPYQYLAAYLNADSGVPEEVRRGLEAAAENACGNIPELPGPVVVGLDVSGSMGSAVTGRGKGTASKMRCVDVAALFAAAIVRRNPGSVIVPFDTTAYRVTVDAEVTILDLSRRLAGYGGGGTDCSVPLAHACTALAGRSFAGCVLSATARAGSARAGTAPRR